MLVTLLNYCKDDEMITIICATTLRLKDKIDQEICVFMCFFGILEFLIEAAIIADYIL